MLYKQEWAGDYTQKCVCLQGGIGSSGTELVFPQVRRCVRVSLCFLLSVEQVLVTAHGEL